MHTDATIHKQCDETTLYSRQNWISIQDESSTAVLASQGSNVPYRTSVCDAVVASDTSIAIEDSYDPISNLSTVRIR